MQRELVSSSAIISVGYDADAMILELEFESGRVYQCFDLPSSVYEAFRAAGSLGGYFNRNIRDHYRCTEL